MLSKKTIHIKRVSIVGLTIMLTAVVTSMANGADGASSSQQRMTSYLAAAGTELTPTEATQIAVSRYAREDGKVFGALHVTTAHANLAQALAVAENHRVADALYGGPEDVTEWRLSPTYLVSMQATEGDVFAPNVSHPPRTSGPTGQVMTVIIGAYSGWRLSLNLSSTAPPYLSELGPSIQTDFAPTTQAAVAAGRRPLGNVGELTGHVIVKKRAKAGWVVVAKRHGVVVARRVTSKGGIFVFRLTPGVYRISALGHHGQECGNAKAVMKRHQETTVSLIC